jgi:hydrogenase-4 membrane subunit HyfE
MCNIHANTRDGCLWNTSKRMSGNLPQAGRIASSGTVRLMRNLRPSLACFVLTNVDMAESMSARDERQLHWLVVFHYIVAAMEALSAVILVVPLAQGYGVVTGETSALSEASSSYGWSLIVFSIIAIVFAAAMALLTAKAGRCISQRRGHSFCTVVATLNCIYFPFGTVLGVLSLIVLKRSAVREAFGAVTHNPNVAAWEDAKLP